MKKLVLRIWVLLMLTLFMVTLSDAQDSDSDDHDMLPDTSITDIDGDNVIALGVGSLGASAMNNCIATTQFSLFILFKNQKIKLDTWCAAEYLDRQGKHREAALMRCSDPVVSKIYEDCADAMMIGNPIPEPSLAGLYNQAAQYDERYEQQQEQQQELEQKVEEQAADYSVLVERLDRKDRAEAAAARKVRQQKAEDNVYLRGLVNELKALGESGGELTQAGN